eukprot:365125-Chlamydomonas_euryale.AAC.8
MRVRHPLCRQKGGEPVRAATLLRLRSPSERSAGEGSSPHSSPAARLPPAVVRVEAPHATAAAAAHLASPRCSPGCRPGAACTAAPSR